MIEAARESGGVEERAITLHDRDFVARAIALQGEVSTILLVRDETRVHHLERVRRDFVSNVSHELRTPITAVQLMAETLANGGLEDPVAAADFVRRIGQEASHMAQMVEELLELSTIESGPAPDGERARADRELMRSLDRLRPLAESKGVTLVVQRRAGDARPDRRRVAPRSGAPQPRPQRDQVHAVRAAASRSPPRRGTGPAC